MVRLIDADKMIKRIESWNTSDATDKALYNFTLNRIIEQPTVDAVPVIRCKDCKYRDEQSANCIRFRKDWYVQSNSFCSWAERKEEWHTQER